jgi:hypothetical protein
MPQPCLDAPWPQHLLNPLQIVYLECSALYFLAKSPSTSPTYIPYTGLSGWPYAVHAAPLSHRGPVPLHHWPPPPAGLPGGQLLPGHGWSPVAHCIGLPLEGRAPCRQQCGIVGWVRTVSHGQDPRQCTSCNTCTRPTAEWGCTEHQVTEPCFLLVQAVNSVSSLLLYQRCPITTGLPHLPLLHLPLKWRHIRPLLVHPLLHLPLPSSLN